MSRGKTLISLRRCVTGNRKKICPREIFFSVTAEVIHFKILSALSREIKSPTWRPTISPGDIGPWNNSFTQTSQI